VAKYDSGGTRSWTKQLGTTNGDVSYGVSADGLGNVYISGGTSGNLGGPNSVGSPDTFTSKYDAAGNVTWIRQLGTTTYDESYGVSADGLGNVYITGYTQGSLGGTYAGGRDAFLAKYDVSGIPVWAKQLGTTADDESYGVSADKFGNVYISGRTKGSLDVTNAGDWDAFVAKYDATGNRIWVKQLGTAGFDESRGISVDGFGNIYISGTVADPTTGSYNVFLAKYRDQPTVPGDYNYDGAVNAADYVLWRKAVGQTGSGLTADGNQNGSVDAADYDMWRAHFSQPAGSGSAASTITTIPEPASLSILLAAGLVILLQRNTHRIA
jgi:hypothetical protein